MTPLFTPPPPESVPEKLEEYGAYLAARDGTPDFAKRTLSRREAQTGAFESARASYEGAFDERLFERQYRRYDVAVETPPAMQLLLSFVKVNANEAFAVERVLARHVPSERLADHLLGLVLLEEGYHTRILLSAARVFGVEVGAPSVPAPFIRLITMALARLPEASSRSVSFAGEAVAAVMFLRTLTTCRRVLKDFPLVRDALEERVTEVLIDEIGHLSFNRLKANRGTFAAMHAVLPVVALGMRGILPEAERLGILPVEVGAAWNFDPKSLPEGVRRRAFVA
jgi:hypothetical protein